MNRIAAWYFAVVAMSAVFPVFGQEWPAKPIRIMLGYTAGGPADIGARLVSRRLSESLKQPVLVENRPGAGGNIAMEAVARAAPDGHTYLYVITAFVINASTYKLNFDPLKDFVPVGHVSSASFLLISNLAFAPKSVAEIIALAKAKPREVTCAHTGSLPQVGCEMLKMLAGIDLTTVPYKGNGPALTDVSAGQVNLLFDVQNSAMPAVRGGRVRAIATANSRRGVGPFGDLPTVAETLPGFEMDGWHGIVAPAGTPRDIVLRMNQAVREAISEGETRKRFVDAGMQVAPGSPEDFGEVLKRDLAKYARVVREAGIKAE